MGALPNLPMIEGAIVRTCIERLGKPAHRARSAPGWLLHLPLALGIVVTQAQEETFAATSGYVTLTVRHVERQRANWRTVENRLAQSPQSGSSPEFNSAELDSAGRPEAKAPDGPEANPPAALKYYLAAVVRLRFPSSGRARRLRMRPVQMNCRWNS